MIPIYRCGRCDRLFQTVGQRTAHYDLRHIREIPPSPPHGVYVPRLRRLACLDRHLLDVLSQGWIGMGALIKSLPLAVDPSTVRRHIVLLERLGSVERCVLMGGPYGTQSLLRATPCLGYHTASALPRKGLPKASP